MSLRRCAQSFLEGPFMGHSSSSDFAADFFATEIRAWRGEEPLWKIFWIYGVAVSSSVVGGYIAAFDDAHVLLRQILLLCFAAYTAWILISVWRCADKTKEKIWGTLARFLTVAWACNAILIITFLQINLIIIYSHG